jgi:cytochrome c
VPKLKPALAGLLLALAACGPGAEGSNGLRGVDNLPPQIGAETYGRFAPTPSARSELPAVMTPAANVPGDPNVGRMLFEQRGCGGCHTLRGLPSAVGVAGPRLDNTAVRPTIAGDQISNTPDNMARWIFDPPSIKPSSTMPAVGVTEQEARDLAAFLYSLPESR